ncbi:MAG: caspase family protein, partial [Thermoguttaceae bacterium]|nr:caspase family protein [Thermoguttaceae bacterium]
LAFLAFFATLSGASFAQTETPIGVKRALLVGVDKYADFESLKYAVADVEAVREQLPSLGFQPENIVVLKSGGSARFLPTLRNIQREIDRLLSEAGPNDLLFLHFSGHGFQSNGAAWFAPLDAEATNDERVVDVETTFSLTKLIERLKVSQAKFKWLIVDACRENPTGTRSAAANEKALTNIDPPPGILVLQSCASGELSYEDPDAGLGLFTGRLLEAMNGKADFDGDGSISALDVCNYVRTHTLAASQARFNANQTPYISGDFSDFTLAANLKKHGLSREDWARAEELYLASVKSAKARDYDKAQTQIVEALAVVADVPKDDEVKERYLLWRDMLDSVSAGGGDATKRAETPSASARGFTRVVADEKELSDALQNAEPGDVIALEDGVYSCESRILLNDSVTLVGKSGAAKKVKIRAIVDVPAEKELRLENLSFDVNTGALTINTSNNSVVRATDCIFTTSGGSYSYSPAGTLTGRGRYILKNCAVMQTAGSDAIVVGEGGSVEAVDCDFTGGIFIADRAADSQLIGCKIHRCAVAVHAEGHWTASSVGPRCEIVDCEIYEVGNGVSAKNGGAIIVSESEFRDVRGGKYKSPTDDRYTAILEANGAAPVSDANVESAAVRAANGGVIELDGVKISDADVGVYVGINSRCSATKTTFADVDDHWKIAKKGQATSDGQEVDDAD